jgi:hypothetical protein
MHLLDLGGMKVVTEVRPVEVADLLLLRAIEDVVHILDLRVVPDLVLVDVVVLLVLIHAAVVQDPEVQGVLKGAIEPMGRNAWLKIEGLGLYHNREAKPSAVTLAHLLVPERKQEKELKDLQETDPHLRTVTRHPTLNQYLLHHIVLNREALNQIK